MKKIVLLLMATMMFSLAGCPSSTVTPTSTVSVAQDTATNSLYAIGVTLQGAPQILDALYTSGKITKDTYNQAVPIYNRALASYNLAVNALKAAVAAGQDPTGNVAYVTALQTFLTDKSNIDNLITAAGGAK